MQDLLVEVLVPLLFFISQCGKLFVFHSPVPLPFVLVLCGPSLIFDFMKYLCLALVSREIDFSYHLFGAPKNPITQAPNHPITQSPNHPFPISLRLSRTCPATAC